MKYIDADKLKAEIERLKEEYNERVSARLVSESLVSMGKVEALNKVLAFIESLQQERPSLPSSLDEAADKFAVLYDQGTCDGIAQDCFKAGAQWRDAQIPKLPDNLDEAARLSAVSVPPIWPEKNIESHIRGFKAGAEWMAGQGETIDGEVLTTSDYGWGTIQNPKKLYQWGTEVTLQIRKKQ